MTKSLQGSAALQEWRKIYNPTKAEELEQKTKRTLAKVKIKQPEPQGSVAEAVFTL